MSEPSFSKTRISKQYTLLKTVIPTIAVELVFLASGNMTDYSLGPSHELIVIFFFL